MSRRWIIAILLGGVSVVGLVRSWNHSRRPGYESHITGDAGARAGFALVEKREYAKALSILERAFQKPFLEVGQADVLAAIGDCYLKMEPDGKSEPQRHQGYLYAGLAARARGDSEKAAADFARALELRPDYAKAYESLGSLLLVQGRYAEAIARLERAVELDGSNAITRANLARVYAAVGRFESAELQVEAAASLGYAKQAQLKEDIAKARAEGVERN